MKRIKRFFIILKNAGIAFADDNCFKLAASLSYYTIFALAPLLLIVVSLAGTIYGADAAQGRLYHEIRQLIGNEAALQIQQIIANIERSHSTTLGTVIGVIILFI